MPAAMESAPESTSRLRVGDFCTFPEAAVPR
jgi:hypothetical protein